MKKRKTIILGSVIASIVIIALTYGLTYAYLIDRDDKDNIITVGNVNLNIVEEGYVNSQPVVAHQIISKAPKVQNTGNTNEYVFLTVRVPKRNVTLLDTDGKKKYTDNNGKKTVEIFSILAPDTTYSNTDVDITDSDIDFKYHNGTDPDSYAEGWILLASETKKNNNDYDEYTFGYNKMLTPNETTSKTLFDKVQLKSFIDQEVTGETNITTKIDIQAYGIQTRNLNITGLADDTQTPSSTDLGNIFNIIKNKKNIT